LVQAGAGGADAGLQTRAEPVDYLIGGGAAVGHFLQAGQACLGHVQPGNGLFVQRAGGGGWAEPGSVIRRRTTITPAATTAPAAAPPATAWCPLKSCVPPRWPSRGAGGAAGRTPSRGRTLPGETGGARPPPWLHP